MIMDTLRTVDIEYVIENLREADRVERYACMTTEEQVHSVDMLKQSALGHTLYLNDRPVAVYGVVANGLGVGGAWMWTTDKFTGDAAIKQTVVDVKRLIQQFFAAGNHRLQVLTMEAHKNSRSFLELVGFKREAVLRCFGADKQDFVMYSIVRTG